MRALRYRISIIDSLKFDAILDDLKQRHNKAAHLQQRSLDAQLALIERDVAELEKRDVDEHVQTDPQSVVDTPAVTGNNANEPMSSDVDNPTAVDNERSCAEYNGNCAGCLTGTKPARCAYCVDGQALYYEASGKSK